MNFSRFQISAFLATAVLVWWVVLVFRDTAVTLDHLAPFGTVVGVLALLAFSFENYLWRQPWLQGWFVNRPDLRGTWHIVLRSDWVDPGTGNQIAPIICFMGVEQSLSRLQMHLMTPESESWFLAHAITPSPSENGYRVVGVYSNKPHIRLREERSRMHMGAVIIDTHGSRTHKPDSLTAEYWTDRKTTGSMTMDRRLAAIFTRYDDARAAFDVIQPSKLQSRST